MDDLFERTILIVDDEEVNRILLGTIIQPEYKVIYAENGKEALEKIHSNGPAISLVLLDLLMPVMDALAINFTRFHLLNQLKGRPFGNEVLSTSFR